MGSPVIPGATAREESGEHRYYKNELHVDVLVTREWVFASAAYYGHYTPDWQRQAYDPHNSWAPLGWSHMLVWMNILTYRACENILPMLGVIEDGDFL